MKRTIALWAAVVGALPVSAPSANATAPAEEPATTASEAAASDSPLTLRSSVAVYSDYMFRGFNLYDGLSIQPSLAASYNFGEFGSLTATYWMHLSGEGGGESEGFTESDLTVAYETEVGPLAVTVGNASYLYPRRSDEIRDTAEAFLILSYEAPVVTQLSAWVDYREFDAQYYEATVSYPYTVGEDQTITPFVSFGFAANARKLYKEDGLVHITEGLTAEVPFGPVTLVPSLNYTHKIDDYTTNELWFGTSVEYGF